MSDKQHTPLLKAVDLKKYYSVKRGVFAAEKP